MTNNIIWHNSRIQKQDRESVKPHNAACLWFTGLSGSGKSTLANEVEFQLNKRKIHTYLLDGDNIRHGLNKNLDFSKEDRRENIRRIGEVANLFVDAGIIVLTAFISPFREDRDLVRKLIPENSFIEIFVKCDLETCELRDAKGFYKKARNNEIKDFTGITSPYEEPNNPELIIENGEYSDFDENVKIIINYLENNSFIN